MIEYLKTAGKLSATFIKLDVLFRCVFNHNQAEATGSNMGCFVAYEQRGGNKTSCN